MKRFALILVFPLTIASISFANDEDDLEPLHEPATVEEPVPAKAPAPKPVQRKINNDDVGGARNESFEDFINNGVLQE